MDFIRLLTSFAGRIGRGQWWLGLVAILAMSFAGAWALNPEIFTTPADQPLPPPSLAATLLGLLLMWPATAVSVKRFNDRNRPWWFGYALGALGAVFTVAPYFGVMGDPLYFSQGEWIAFGIFMLIALAAFIDNGFLKGVAGPNRYGQDPLQAKAVTG